MNVYKPGNVKHKTGKVIHRRIEIERVKKMAFKIGVIRGDGIGPEIVGEALKVLQKVSEKYSQEFEYTEILLGGASIDVHGEPLTKEALAAAKECDAVLMGSIGGDTTTSPWYKLPANLRPEAGLLAIRKGLGLFANMRPAYLYEELKDACPLKEEIIGDGFDLVVMRELTGGLYFGDRKTTEENGLLTAVDTLTYNEEEIRRIALRHGGKTAWQTHTRAGYRQTTGHPYSKRRF